MSTTNLRVATMVLPKRAFEDGITMGRALAAQLFPLAERGVQLAVLPGFYGLGLWLSGDGRPRTAEALREEFLTAASRAARASGLFLVPGSLPLPTADGRYRNYAVLCNPQGEIVGEAVQTHRGRGEEDLEPGDDLPVLPTPWGGLGFLLGADPWYPEAGRILVRRGADILVAPLAPRAPYAPEEAMAGLWATVQASPAFGIESGLRGPLGEGEVAGRAAVVGPAGLTPDGTGFLSGPGYLGNEGYLLAELDLEGLRELRRETPRPFRTTGEIFRRHLDELYRETVS